MKELNPEINQQREREVLPPLFAQQDSCGTVEGHGARDERLDRWASEYASTGVRRLTDMPQPSQEGLQGSGYQASPAGMNLASTRSSQVPCAGEGEAVSAHPRCLPNYLEAEEMKLSEAIFSGSVLVKPEAGSWTACAFGMARHAIGKGHESWMSHDFIQQWPWVTTEVAHPSCGCFTQDFEAMDVEAMAAIIHLFDKHVMGRSDWTLEQLVDYVRSIEPADEPQHIGNTITDLETAVLNAEIKAGIERNALQEGETGDSQTYAELSAGIQRGCR